MNQRIYFFGLGRRCIKGVLHTRERKISAPIPLFPPHFHPYYFNRRKLPRVLRFVKNDIRIPLCEISHIGLELRKDSETSGMNSERLGEIFEGDYADTCTDKFLLILTVGLPTVSTLGRQGEH